MPEAPFEDHSDLSAASSASTHPNLAKMIADVPSGMGTVMPEVSKFHTGLNYSASMKLFLCGLAFL
jgi:hypothetical protein